MLPTQTGIQEEEELHSNARTQTQHCRGFLAYDLAGGGSHYMHARERSRKWKSEYYSLTKSFELEQN